MKSKLKMIQIVLMLKLLLKVTSYWNTKVLLKLNTKNFNYIYSVILFQSAKKYITDRPILKSDCIRYTPQSLIFVNANRKVHFDIPKEDSLLKEDVLIL